MLRRLAALWTIAALALAASVQAAPLEVDAAFAHADLDRQMVLLEDPSGDLAFEQVRQRSDFAAPGPKGANLGFTGSAWWARVDLHNGGDQPLALLLRQHYPLIDYIDAWL